jgi:hypothetical protein
VDIFPASQPFDFGRAKYQKGGHFGPVKQTHLDLGYLYRGTATIIADGETYVLGATSISGKPVT